MTETVFKTWAESAARLVAVAAGRAPADLVIRGGQWVNVQSREVLAGHDIAIADGRFAYCGPDAGHTIGEATQVIEAEGRFMIPGLCDGHMHIESGMLTPAEFARAVIPHGTTTMFTDPHEIANVLGLRGVRLMHDEAMLQPVNIFTQMPSCAPSAPGLETTGFEITPEVEAMVVLNDREKDILMERRLKDQPSTLEELSGKYDVSRERIRQIEVRAFEKLQKRMRELAREKGMLAPA